MSNNIYDILNRLNNVAKETPEPTGRAMKSKLEETITAIESSYDNDEMDMAAATRLGDSDDEWGRMERELDDSDELEEGPSKLQKAAKWVKRGLKGWGDGIYPDEIKARHAEYDDETLLRLRRKQGDDATPHSPGDFQTKVIDRELKKRYGLTPKGNMKANEAAPYIGDKVTTRSNPLVFIYDAEGGSKGHMNLVTFMSIYGIDSSKQYELAQRVKDDVSGQIPVRTREGERVYIKYSPHTDKELGRVKEVAQKFTQGGKTYVTGGDEGDEVVKAFDDPQDAQKFMSVNRTELNRPDPDPEKITDLADDDMTESFKYFNPGDTVQVKEGIKNWAGQTGKVTLVHEGNVYVKIKTEEVEFNPTDLINKGIVEAFGAYDDFEAPAPDINPDLVPFDYENPEHRERLQRGTRVVLVPVLFQDQGTDRSGVLTDISKTGFFCKVIRSADGKTINAHMSDIELADLYNNTVYEDYNKALDSLLEDITVTKTENPEEPQNDTITITGTDEHVALLSDLMKMAGLSDSYYGDTIPMDMEPAPVSMEPDYDPEGEELLMQYREERDTMHANTPNEKVAPVRAVTHGTSLKGLNGQKRQYRKEYPGDNVMTANEGQMSELDIILQDYPLNALQNWASGGSNYPEQLDQDLAEFMGYDDTGSGMAFERVWRELKDEVAAYVNQKQMGESQVNEKAPPGMEDWIKDRKAEFKDRYGDRWQEVLYATAWKQHNKESIGESNMNEFERILAAYDPRELMAWAEGNSDAASGLADEILGLEGRWDTGSGMEEERVWNEYKDEVAAYAQEKMGMRESKRAGAPLDEVESFFNLYKAFGERGEKR
jgi:hypothetical protein